MTKTVKIITITLASAIVLCGLFVLGFRGFTHLIYSQRGCEWANIDNIELHTHIDIPKIKGCDCEYKKELNTKIARFDIDRSKVDMERYIRINNFKKLLSPDEVQLNELIKSKSNVGELSKEKPGRLCSTILLVNFGL
ncbi:MAG: hypothetical protein WC833_06680 [Bacteroidales bacterium]|jgi:hypothetical protein